MAITPSYASDLGPFDLSGFVGIEGRLFPNQPQFFGQESDPELSLVIQPEFRYRTEDRRHQFSFIPFYRLDSRDEERTHFDIREAYWLYIGDEFEVLTGINTVFWGVTESRHLVNIINQIDNVEDIDGEDFLGQAMINFATQRDWGRIDLFILPGFRERTFSGVNGRFRPAVPIDTDEGQFESSGREERVDFAARYSHFIGNWDIGLSYFYGTDREPVFDINTDGSTTLIPIYNLINQFGTEVQYTTDAWLWKFEGIVREGQGDTFGAFVGGFEYTFYQVFDQDWDIGVLAEYQYDNRSAEAPFTIQDNDVFMGMRLTLNDIQDTAMLAGVSVDHRTGEQFYNVEAERRLGDNYQIEFRARFFEGAEENDISAVFQEDDYFQLRLSRYF